MRSVIFNSQLSPARSTAQTPHVIRLLNLMALTHTKLLENPELFPSLPPHVTVWEAASLKPGQGHKDLPKHLQVKSAYSGAYGRLTKNLIAPTITRWVFHPGSGRWGHPVDNRTLSIREIARIQSFPDSFEFIGTYTLQAGQLGNAVPPLLIQKLAEQLLAQTGISS